MTTVEELVKRGLVPRHPCVASTELDGMHALVDFDPAKRVKERFLELIGDHEAVVHLRTSPDITHMFIGPDGWSPTLIKVRLTCDESLPPNSIVLHEDDIPLTPHQQRYGPHDCRGGAPGDRYPF